MDRPGIIGRLLLESPSLFISNRQVLKSSGGFRQWPARVFIAMGTKESGNLTAIDRWSRMFVNWNTICAAPDWEMTACW